METDISPILVTGAAGFIGAAICEKLILNHQNVIGIDNLNNYYDPKLKLKRLEGLYTKSKQKKYSFIFHKGSINDEEFLNNIFEKFSPKTVINLAAQAGVRYSLKNPISYINSNLVGFSLILEACRKYSVRNFIYASSSSVYGGNKLIPYSENHNVDHPISLYAATKKSNELMAHSYSHLYGIPSIGLRFFTVYGPWGRPDMAPMIFARSILSKEKILVFNNGDMLRDFTYIDDVIESLWRCILKPATVDSQINSKNDYPSSSSIAAHRIFNVGNNKPVNLLDFIKLLEEELGQNAIMEFKPLQPGDVINTHSDTNLLQKWINYKPTINLEEGIKRFSSWYLEFHNNSI